jgi:hypothetical protein
MVTTNGSLRSIIFASCCPNLLGLALEPDPLPVGHPREV